MEIGHDVMHISFIITCYNREEYLPHLIKILQHYKKIKPTWAICYNGDKDINCDFKCPNRGLHRGDYDLTMGGYQKLKNTGHRFIKLSCDSWLLDEEVVINIFNIMKERRCCYAGSYWWGKGRLATDVFFADTKYGNLFNNLRCPPKINDGEIEWQRCALETTMGKIVKKTGAFYIIPERNYVNATQHRHECNELSWCMHHNLNKNLEYVKRHRQSHYRIF
jgi:hypothetical protein